MKRLRPTPTNAQLIAGFLAYLRAERGAAANTVWSYEHDLNDFARWLGKSLQLALRTDLQEYMSDCLESGASGRSVARYLSVLRHFYRFLIDEDEMKSDPTRNLPAPKCWNTVPRAASLADVHKMVAGLGTSWLDIRDKAMLLVLFASGLRESELARLKVEDLDLDAGAAKVWEGKGGKDGLVPLSPPAIDALRVYLGSVRPKLAAETKSPCVFLTGRGEPLTRMAIWCRVSKAAEASLGKRVSPHSLRHGFATALVQGGADIRDVQVLMRHSSVDTTAVYIHCDLTYLRKVYYASHPRARIAPPES